MELAADALEVSGRMGEISVADEEHAAFRALVKESEERQSGNIN